MSRCICKQLPVCGLTGCVPTDKTLRYECLHVAPVIVGRSWKSKTQKASNLETSNLRGLILMISQDVWTVVISRLAYWGCCVSSSCGTPLAVNLAYSHQTIRNCFETHRVFHDKHSQVMICEFTACAADSGWTDRLALIGPTCDSHIAECFSSLRMHTHSLGL